MIIGATNIAALAAEAKSAPNRKPRFAVFQFTSFFCFAITSTTDGNCESCSAGESFFIVVGGARSVLGWGGGCGWSGIVSVKGPARSALEAAGRGVLLAATCRWAGNEIAKRVARYRCVFNSAEFLVERHGCILGIWLHAGGRTNLGRVDPKSGRFHPLLSPSKADVEAVYLATSVGSRGTERRTFCASRLLQKGVPLSFKVLVPIHWLDQ